VLFSRLALGAPETTTALHCSDRRTVCARQAR
jgi:hypothetical protein